VYDIHLNDTILYSGGYDYYVIKWNLSTAEIIEKWKFRDIINSISNFGEFIYAASGDTILGYGENRTVTFKGTLYLT
jgi:hypothetical protein